MSASCVLERVVARPDLAARRSTRAAGISCSSCSSSRRRPDYGSCAVRRPVVIASAAGDSDQAAITSSTSSSSSGGGGEPAAPSAAPPPHHRKPGRMNRLLQNVNVAGTSLFFQILVSDRPLAVPHLSVPDIRHVDWDALSAAGFKAAVFDKDNTLCRPFALEPDPLLRPSLEAARRAFGGRLAIYSNSAGLAQYDPDGAEAEALEAAFGVHCLRHNDKKPAGGCAELEARFGCPAADVVFVGDRYLTDVVFGNRHGMLTVRVAPLSLDGEPPGVLVARRVEEAFVSRWEGQGVEAPAHARVPGGRAEIADKLVKKTVS